MGSPNTNITLKRKQTPPRVNIFERTIYDGICYFTKYMAYIWVAFRHYFRSMYLFVQA